MTYRYEWTDDDRCDAAADALAECAAFVRDATEDDPNANVQAAANEAVACMYRKGGMQAVRDFVEDYEAADQQMRLEARKEAA